MDHGLVCLLLILFPTFGTGIQSLKNVQARVPLATRVHETVTLQCQYDLEGDQLYTLKWYKGTMEFFRYVPKEVPSILLFPVPGVHVDSSRTSTNEIFLLDVQQETTGRYKCEVSTDAPNFYTYVVSNFMYVIDVPEEAPLMEMRKEIFGLNHRIKANCTTPPSYPAMNVSWYINGLKVPDHGRRSIPLQPVRRGQTNLKNPRVPCMTISYMERDIDDNMFQDGIIKVQCISTLFNLYRSEDVRYIEENGLQPWPSSVIGAKENVAGSNRWSVGASIGAILAVMTFR